MSNIAKQRGFPYSGAILGAVGELEELLKGKPTREVLKILTEFYAGRRVETPGITADDWLKVLSS